MRTLLPALFALFSAIHAQAAEYQIPYAFQLAVKEDGVPLLAYDKREEGGVLAFKLSPMFKDPVAPPAPMEKILEASPKHPSILVEGCQCYAEESYDLLCQAKLTQLGERVLLKALNHGMLALGLNIVVRPQVEVDPSAPIGSDFTIGASLQHNYFIQHPILPH